MRWRVRMRGVKKWGGKVHGRMVAGEGDLRQWAKWHWGVAYLLLNIQLYSLGAFLVAVEEKIHINGHRCVCWDVVTK